MTKHLHLKKVLATLLTIVAVFAGQQASATITSPMSLTGNSALVNGQYYHVWKTEGFLGNYSQPRTPGNSYTFNGQPLSLQGGNVRITGTLNFTQADNLTDVTTGSTVTVEFYSTNFWFFNAEVKKLDGTSVSGCSYSASSDHSSITVTIPSGKTFGNIYLSYSFHPQMTESNTTISGIEASYIYQGSAIRPQPTVVYTNPDLSQTTLTLNTDYTLSYTNNNGPGIATVIITGAGEYAGTLTRTYTIRNIDLNDFNSLGNNTYEIANKDDLDHLALLVDVAANDCQGLTFKQTADITYSHGSSTTENNFTQIGGYFGGDKNFSGTYDGQNHTISGIRVYKSPTNSGNENKNVALFGRISGATIQNVILTDARITGYRYVGGLVGNKASGTVQNCLIVGSTITCGNTYGGALFGNNNGTLTANHYRNCTVNNTTNATNVGVGNGSSSSDMAGARSVHPLTIQNANITATGESVAYQGTTYYASNTQITLGYNNLPAGYTLTYTLNGTALSGNTFTMPANDNATVNATLTPITYNITYDLAGGSVTTANPTTYNIETATFTLNNPTREGYTFAGWTGTDLNEPTLTVTIAQGSIGDRSYTATWNTITYNITYDLAGGSVATANPTSYTVETPTFTLNNPTKAGYTFTGWTGSNGTTPQTEVTIAQGSTGNLNYTAQWTQYAFTLSLGTDITASGTVAFTYEGTDYFTPGTIITLAYGGTIPEGYRPLYSVNGNAIVGNTFEMPTADVVVDAVLLERYYTFNSTTGVLALLWGEFNKDNKWGSEVTESAVTSVTATDEVSFTGDCYELFYNFTSCTSMDLTDVNTANVTNMSHMFYRCRSLQSLGLSGWNTANVTDMKYMFYGCSGLQSLNVSGWNTANVTDMYYMFGGCSGLQSLDLSGWNTANVTNMSNIFSGCSSLQSLNLTGWNTANVTSMYYMFDGCSGLQSLNISGWNTAKVTNMSNIFSGCSSLQSLVLSGWNTARVTNISNIFSGCSSLQSLDLSGWNTARVKLMVSAFRNCSGLQSLNVSGWNTANVIAMDYMFEGCSSLQSLDLSGWNTAKVTNMRFMFEGCSSLQSLNISGWNTAKVTNMSYMFRNCTDLATIYVGEGWNTSRFNESTDMFDGCTSLVGGMGTTYDAYHTDGEYARIDRGLEEPGYFTGRFTKEIAGYEDNKSGWYLIASPLAADIAPTAVTNMTNGTFDLYYFDQTGGTNGKEWKNWKNEGGDGYHFNLEAGKGYLYANSGNVTLMFTGVPYDGDGEVNLTYSTDNPNATMHGWNLIGNPFSTNATIGDTPFYRMNAAGSEIIAADVNDNTVNPMEGIFVKAIQANQTITFETAMTRGNANSNSAALVMDISQNRGGVIDRAIVRFDEGQTLPKFQIHENSTKIYIPQDGTDYAVAVIASDSEAIQPTEHPIHFKAAENGTYTLTISTTFNSQLSTVNYLHLIDNLTGADVDLLVPNGGDARPCVSTYTFTAKTTDYESRFKLVFAVGSSTGSDTFAFISNGNIIVNGEGTLQIFDAMGRQLFSKELSTFNSQLSTLNYTPGVYVLRLINGENVRTQKIVIE